MLKAQKNERNKGSEQRKKETNIMKLLLYN